MRVAPARQPRRHTYMVVFLNMVKVTFTVDPDTVATLKRLAQRLQKPQSAVIRDAIVFYEPHAGQLTAAERRKRVELFDRVLAEVPAAPAAAVDRELRAVRRSRRTGWSARGSRRD